LVHAIEPLSYSLDFTLTLPLQEKTNRDMVEKRLADLTAVLSEQQGLTAGYELLDKPTVDGILETCAIKQADLIIMGTHGRKGLSRMVLGSTVCKVLEQSPYPVLTVKSPKFEGGHHPAHGTDHTSTSPA
jgi:nucleotide-binding universal stress UspA family protein